MTSLLRLLLLPILILLAFTLPHLEQGDFRRDTVRYAAVGHYMWSGGSLLTPYLTSEKPYFNKPPMALWIHGLFLKAFGMHLTVARLPSVLAAAGVLIFSILAVANLATRGEALLSGVVLATTYEFFRRTREISLDFWQLFFVMVAVWLVTLALREGRRSGIILCGIPLGLALLCKPLVALGVFPIFALWLLWRDRGALLPWLFAGALPLALLIAAPWHLYMYSVFGQAFLDQYFGNEIVARAQRSDQASTIFYYLKENAATYWPWMLGLAYAVYLAGKPPRPSRSELLVLAAAWVIPVLLALSFFADRKPNYALPLYPMLSWMVAWGLARLPRVDLAAWLERHQRTLSVACLVLLPGLWLAPIQFQRPPEKHSVALVNWLRSSGVEVDRMFYERVEQQDVSYVYVKTGKWMKSLKLHAGEPNESGSLVLTKVLSKKSPPAGQDVRFHSGPFNVTEFKGAAVSEPPP